jgi:Outer membrane protein beta-barrel domain
MWLECQASLALNQDDAGRSTTPFLAISKWTVEAVFAFLMEYFAVDHSTPLVQYFLISLLFRDGYGGCPNLSVFDPDEGADNMRSRIGLTNSLNLLVRGSMLGVLVLAASISAAAQLQSELTHPKVEAKTTFGSAIFGEDIEHKLYGASMRVYITRRLSIEPEYLYLRHSENDQDQLFQPNVAYDFTDPTKRFVAYGIAGIGVMHHKGRYLGNDFYTGEPILFDTSFTTWTASVGGGIKIFATKRLFIAPELRVGRQPGVRGTINVGYVFVGRK